MGEGMDVDDGKRYLLTFSGGIDSTYALWRMLKAGHRVVALHVDISNLWGRDYNEGRAVDNVRQYLEENGLAERLEWERGGCTYGNVISPKYTRTVEVARFFAGQTLRRPEMQDIRCVIASGIKEDPHLSREWVRNIHVQMESAARRRVHLIRLIRHLSKGQVMQDMPPELLKLAWYCDHPNGGVACKTCHTCKQVETFSRNVKPREQYGVLTLNMSRERPGN